MTDKISQERHIISVKVDNVSGALERIVGIFSSRGFNIDSLTVAEVDNEKNISRITITVSEPEERIQHIINLIERIIPVYEAKHLTADNNYAERGLILIKVNAIGENRNEIFNISHSFQAREVDITDSSITFELTEIPQKLNEFISLMKPYGVLGIARTGITAITRGNEEF